jgi:hypothetical protein
MRFRWDGVVNCRHPFAESMNHVEKVAVKFTHSARRYAHDALVARRVERPFTADEQDAALRVQPSSACIDTS